MESRSDGRRREIRRGFTHIDNILPPLVGASYSVLTINVGFEGSTADDDWRVGRREN